MLLLIEIYFKGNVKIFEEVIEKDLIETIFDVNFEMVVIIS